MTEHACALPIVLRDREAVCGTTISGCAVPGPSQLGGPGWGRAREGVGGSRWGVSWVRAPHMLWQYRAWHSGGLGR
eukprot:2874973-Rhodomonas_salina.1